MLKSHIIEINGHFAGVAVTADGRYRFIAVDLRLADLDSTEWASLAEVRSVVGRALARTEYLAHVPPGAIERRPVGHVA